MANDRILWERPMGCVCGALLRESGNGLRMVLVRVTKAECLLHGTASRKITVAAERALAVARTVPGMESLTQAQLERIIRAAIVEFGLVDPPGPPTPPDPPTPEV